MEQVIRLSPHTHYTCIYVYAVFFLLCFHLDVCTFFTNYKFLLNLNAAKLFHNAQTHQKQIALFV